MEHNRAYIEELIGKLLQNQLTADEAVALEQEKQKYTTAEYERLVIDSLVRSEGQLPKEAWTDWKPDLAKIRKEGNRRRAVRDAHTASRWWVAAAIGVLIPVVLILLYPWSRQEEIPELENGLCTEIDRDMEYPVWESGFGLRYGDGTMRRIYPGEEGLLVHISGLLLIRERDGVLRLAYDDHVLAAEDQGDYVDITTERMQQCLVELPDGTRIRLNAQSILRYPVGQEGIPLVSVIGEAHVQVASGSPLLLRTVNSVISTVGADFVVKSEQNHTRAIVSQGVIGLHHAVLEERTRLDSYCAQLDWGLAVDPEDGLRKYRLSRTLQGDLQAALRWTKAVRHYRDVPLRQYYQEMERWYGLRVKDIRCLPIDRRVNTVSCYRDDYQRVLLAIRSAGVPVVETKGMLSFCPDEE